MSSHQIEYEKLFTQVLDKYKQMHNLSITNREIRDAIHLKLHQKLIIDFITNTKFATNEAKQITSLIKYCKRFIKDTLLQDQTKIYEAVDAAI